MNETIGVKGGQRDYKRTLIISKNKAKRLAEYQKELDKYELERLEKRVKQLQRATFIKVVPIAITGTILKTFTTSQKKESDSIEQSELIENQEKNIINPNNISIIDKNNIRIVNDKTINLKKSSPIYKNIVFYPTIKQVKKQSVDIKEIKQDEIILPTTYIKQTVGVNENIIEDRTILDLSQLKSLKNRKIIEEYEKVLKTTRYELRKLMFDYNVLANESESIYTKKEAEELLDKLSYMIKKIEQLKNKIKVENLDKYDDNYIYTLIEEYLLEFKDKKVVSELKDSNLYILISDKIEELDKKKKDLNKKVESRKEYLEAKEIDFEKLKEKYYDYDKFNNMLIRFQYDQDRLLLDLKYKMDKAVSVEQKVEKQVQTLTEQSLKLLKIMREQMFLPGVRGTKRTMTMAGIFMYFMNSVLNEPKIKKKYKIVNVADYSYEIEKSLDEIDNINSMLNKTTKQVDKMIKKFKEDYNEFIGVIPECNKLLSNLESVKEQLSEREYEIAKIKSEQSKNLIKNQHQLKKAGKYEM